tara:strand:+ start:29000 stop:29413 length:414 start_codon:yes stop_codon:yes gene_type:complete
MKDELLNQIDEIVAELIKKNSIVTHDGRSGLYDSAISFLNSHGLIKNERNAYRYIINSPEIFNINEIGISEYLNENNRIKNLEITIKELTAINVDLQNKQLKRDVLFSTISFVVGAVITNIKDILILLEPILSFRIL